MRLAPIGARAAAALAGAALAAAAWTALRARSAGYVELPETARRGRVYESVYGIGTVTASRSFVLKPAVPTTVRRLYVREGETVERGQRLLSLDEALFTAPFRGTVTSLPVKEGETVFGQTPTLELVDLQDRYVVVALEQRAAIRARRGQDARLSFENMRAEPYAGEVKAVYSSGGSFLVRIDAPHLPAEVLPGMTADVSIVVGERPEALLVPAAAIRDGRVGVARGGRREERSVRAGLSDGAWVEISSGAVEPGDRFLVPRRRPP